MATLHNLRKRRRPQESLHEGRPTKARKVDTTLPNEHSGKRQRRDQTVRDKAPAAESAKPPTPEQHASWRYPPEFWDRLSTIPLIREALEELDRRTRVRPAYPLHPPPPSPSPPTAFARDVARFARHGGPDLCDIRGYPAPPAATAARDHRSANAMSQSSQSRATKSTDPTTVTKSGTTKSRKSISAYNRGFDQHLTDHGIHTSWDSQEPDLDAVHLALANPRPSLSPSQFSDSAFKAFRKTNDQAKDEDDVLADVIPTIAGTREANYPSARNTAFLHLEPLTDGTIVPPKPDIYYGAVPEQLNPTIRDALGPRIVPSIGKPIAPNFFVEAKGPDGSAAVMIRQARYDGAVGTRTMHSLQNYGQDESAYDGKPYTYSSTYHGGTGTLQLYAHHATAPAIPDGQPEYHMTRLRGYTMTDTHETFLQGATAFRNARDLAKQHRDTFIQAANSRHHTRLASASVQELTVSNECDYTPNNIDRQHSASPCQLQQSDEHHDSSQEPQSSIAATEPPPSFTTGLTLSPPSSSSIREDTDQPTASSKRPRSSQSPPSVSHRSKKHGHRRTK